MSIKIASLFRQSILNFSAIQFVSHDQPLHLVNSVCLSKYITSCWRRHHSTGEPTSEPAISEDLRERARQRIAEFEAQQSVSPNSPLGIMDRVPNTDLNAETVPVEELAISTEQNAFAPFPNNVNPTTGEVRGPTGPEPTRFGDWERKGRCSDF